MAEILPFATSGSHRPKERLHASGEIVIFPGVRVEYHHDRPPNPPAKSRQRRAKRNASADALTV